MLCARACGVDRRGGRGTGGATEWYDVEGTNLDFADDFVLVHVRETLNGGLAEDVAEVFGRIHPARSELKTRWHEERGEDAH